MDQNVLKKNIYPYLVTKIRVAVKKNKSVVAHLQTKFIKKLIFDQNVY